jgi:hypothetical protein
MFPTFTILNLKLLRFKIDENKIHLKLKEKEEHVKMKVSSKDVKL